MGDNDTVVFRFPLPINIIVVQIVGNHIHFFDFNSLSLRGAISAKQSLSKRPNTNTLV